MKKTLLALIAFLLLQAPALAQSAPKKYLSAASTNATLVQTGRAVVYTLAAVNTTATIYYLKLYNKATAPTCGTDTPVMTIPVPASTAGDGIVVAPTVGILFQLGLGFCLTGAIGDSDTTNAATGVAINFGVGN